MNNTTISHDRFAGLKLGLGIGLVVGIIFQPRQDAYPRRFVDSHMLRSTTASDQAAPKS
jgi:hypothetical protein